MLAIPKYCGNYAQLSIINRASHRSDIFLSLVGLRCVTAPFRARDASPSILG